MESNSKETYVIAKVKIWESFILVYIMQFFIIETGIEVPCMKKCILNKHDTGKFLYYSMHIHKLKYIQAPVKGCQKTMHSTVK